MKRLFGHAGRSKPFARLVPLVVLAALLISMAPAFLPAPTGAQDGDQTTPVAEVQENVDTPEDAQDSADAPPAETVEAETAEPIVTPTTEPDIQAGGVAAFVAEARSCPAGFDPSAGDAATALANCAQPLAGIPFTLGTQDPAYPGDTRTTNGDGVAAWSDIPLGAGFFVSASVPQGSGEPWVYCELTGGAGGDQYLFFSAAGGSMDIGLSDPGQTGYAQTFCRWFVVQPENAALAATPDENLALGQGEIRIANYRCPVNYNTADMTLPALQAACATPGDGFQFTLKASRGSARTGTTDAQGAVSWTAVPPGSFTIAESIPSGYLYAQPYCSAGAVGGAPGSPDLSLVQSDGKTIGGKLLAGQSLVCSLFNIAVPESTIALLPFLCPSDYNTADMTLQALTAGCSIPGTQIGYSLTTPNGGALTGNTGANGFYEFTNVPSGAVAIEESVPAGYWLGAVYCDPAPPQGELDGAPWQMPMVEDGVISYDVPDRYSLNCFIFHIWIESPAPQAGASVVNLTSYLCPPGMTFDDLATVANDSSRCHGAAGWTYAHAGDGFTETVTTDPVGATTASHAPAGPFTLTAPAQEDSRPVALWCSSNGGDFQRKLGSGETTFAYTPAAGEVLNCQWFNVSSYPEGTFVTITIDTRLCGSDYPKTTMVEDWRQGCPNPHAGETFEALQADGSTVSGTTGNNGLVTLQVLPGDVYINEGQPDAYPGGYAWCGTRVAGSEPVYVNAGRLSPGEPGMPLSNVKPDYTYVCQWFDAPLGSPAKAASGSGQVSVTVWRCPEGVDPAGATLDQLFASCPTPQPGVQIEIAYVAGESFTMPTRLEKGPAIARFDELPAGKVGIGAYMSSGQKLARAFCKTGDVGLPGLALSDGYAEYTVADGGVAAEVADGKIVDCQFFQVPTGDAGESPKAGMVYVDTRGCPPGFAVVPASYVDIAMYCAAEGGVDIKVTSGATTQSAVSMSDGVAAVSGVAPGSVRIAELPREGYDPAKVFCRATAEDAGATGELKPVAVDNWAISYDLAEGDYLECVWANMPAATTTTDPAIVVLHAYRCPEGTGPYASLQELFAACTDRPEGVGFTAGPPLTTPVEAKTGTNGDATFTGLTPGFEKIEQTAGQGAQPFAAWCSYFASATGSPRDAARHQAGPLYAYMSGGYTLDCYWFDVPYVEPVTVTILERLCPADYGTVGASREDLLFNCTDSVTGVEFRVRNEGGAVYDRTQATDAAGSAIFLEAPVTPLAIAEGSLEYEAVSVYCGQGAPGSDDLPATYSELDVVDEAVAYTVQPGGDVLCYWIAVAAPDEPAPTQTPTPSSTPTTTPTSTPTQTSTPTPTQTPAPATVTPPPATSIPSPTVDPDAPATLALSNYRCPEGYDVYAAESDPVQDCDAVAPGIEFSIVSIDDSGAPSAPAGNMTSHDDGAATFVELEPGLWLVTASLPDATQTAFISSCASDRRDIAAQNPFTPLTYVGPDGQIGFGLIGGETLTCDVYVVPEREDETD